MAPEGLKRKPQLDISLLTLKANIHQNTKCASIVRECPGWFLLPKIDSWFFLMSTIFQVAYFPSHVFVLNGFEEKEDHDTSTNMFQENDTSTSKHIHFGLTWINFVHPAGSISLRLRLKLTQCHQMCLVFWRLVQRVQMNFACVITLAVDGSSRQRNVWDSHGCWWFSCPRDGSTPCLDNHLQLSTNISWYTWAIPPFWLVKSKLLVVKPTVLGSQINFFGGSITLKPLVLARSNYLINAVWWFTMVTVTQSLEKDPKDQWYIIWLVLSSCPITNI